MSTDLQERPGHDAAAEGAPSDPQGSSYLWDRVLFPLLVIAVSGLVILTVVLNVSRIFLSEPGNGAIALCSAIATVGFLTAIWASYQSRMPNSQSYALLAGIGLIVIIAGWALIDNAEGHGGEEEVAAASSVAVDSFNFGFTLNGQPAVNEEAPAVEFVLTSSQGSHSFVIEGLEAEMRLLADQSGGSTGRIILSAGTEYVYYCDIPGHRQNGMEGTMTVAEAPPGQVVGEGSDEGGVEGEDPGGQSS